MREADADLGVRRAHLCLSQLGLADVGCGHIVAEAGQPDRLRSDPAGAIEDGSRAIDVKFFKNLLAIFRIRGGN